MISNAASLGRPSSGSAGILVTNTHGHAGCTHTPRRARAVELCRHTSKNVCVSPVCRQCSHYESLADGFHGKAPGKQRSLCHFDPGGSEDDWLIMPLITANVWLSPSSATQAGGGAVELKTTQTTIHQLMNSSYTSGWEGWA